jgi:hypothetical protein
MMEVTKRDSYRICLNGHLIEEFGTDWADDDDDFCEICGALILKRCIHCKAPIKMDFLKDHEKNPEDKVKLPKFCHHCGTPYPWAGGPREPENKDIEFEDPQFLPTEMLGEYE